MKPATKANINRYPLQNRAMQLHILAIGQRLPAWAEEACADYARRFPPTLRLTVKALRAEPRTSGKTPPQMMALEAARLRAAAPADARIIALDERGERLRTQQLAECLTRWQQEQGAGGNVALLIGGPDGLDEGLRADAHERLRLSDLTLPHALARVLLIEQLYRAWSITAGHPYHRE